MLLMRLYHIRPSADIGAAARHPLALPHPRHSPPIPVIPAPHSRHSRAHSRHSRSHSRHSRAPIPVIPAPIPVIPAPIPVIPAQAGILSAMKRAAPPDVIPA